MNRTLTAEEASALLRQGEPIEDATITGELELRQLSENDFGTVRRAIIVRRCHLEGVDAAHLLFESHILFEDCTFQKASFAFWAAYFSQGAEFLSCTFLEGTSFGCGGHNDPLTLFHLKGCTFKGFVDFYDAWFTGPIEVENCSFEQGTNLLVEGEVLFDVPPVIQGNSGNLKLDAGFRRND